jgi:hypothetical protein
MGNMTDEDMESIIYKMRSYTMSNGESPYEHLYDWLKEKDPMLFKQWQAVYDITKGF